MHKRFTTLVIAAVAVLAAGACTQYAPSGPPPGSLRTGVCHSIVGGTQSFEYLGPANTLANSLLYPDSDDCSTAPADNAESAVLTGMIDQAAAEAQCDALLPGGNFVSSLSVLEPIVPDLNSADYWGCFVL